MTAGLGAIAREVSQAGTAISTGLKPGDIVYADSGNALEGGFIIKVDPDTGSQTVISSGGNLVRPFDVKLDAQGQLIVADTGQYGALIRIDPTTGEQTVIKDPTESTLGVPCGMALVRGDAALVANAQAIVRVDLAAGTTRIIAGKSDAFQPLGVTFANNGNELLTLNRTPTPEILRINSNSGRRSVVTRGDLLRSPQAMVANGNDIYVTDVANTDGNYGVGRIIHVDAKTGTQTVVSEGGLLVGPVGISVNDSGELIIGDPYTINRDSPDLYDGAIIKIDPRTGDQTLVARGRGSCVNPRGVAIVPGEPQSKSGHGQ